MKLGREIRRPTWVDQMAPMHPADFRVWRADAEAQGDRDVL